MTFNDMINCNLCELIKSEMFHENLFELPQPKQVSKDNPCRISHAAQGDFAAVKIAGEGIQFLDLRDGITAKPIPKKKAVGYEAFALSPNGRYLATFDADAPRNKNRGEYLRPQQILLWDTKSEKLIHKCFWDFVFPEHISPYFSIHNLTFSSDGKQLIVTSTTGEVAVWSVSTGKLLRFIGQAMLETVSTAMSNNTKYFSSFEISRRSYYDPNSFVWVGRYFDSDGVLYSYHSRAWYQDNRENGVALTPVTPAPLGTSVVGWNFDDEIFKLWDAYSGAEIHDFEIDGDTHNLQFSHDDCLLAGEVNQHIHLWDVETGLVEQYIKHDKASKLVGFSQDDKYLIARCERDILIWHIKKQAWIASHTLHGSVAAIAMSSTNRIVAILWRDNRWSLSILDIQI